MKANILLFLHAAESFGVARYRLFQVADLLDNRNFVKVIECLEDLALVVERIKNMPSLKSVAEKRKWSEVQLSLAKQSIRGDVTTVRTYLTFF
jgi:hypothetical protein